MFKEMAACLILFLMVYPEYLWCRFIIRHMHRKKKEVMQMVVTVRRASQVPVCSGWLTVLLSPSELHGKPECQSQISTSPADMQQRSLRRSGCLMCPPCWPCLRCSGLKWSWPTSRLHWKWFAAWHPVDAVPASSPCLPRRLLLPHL